MAININNLSNNNQVNRGLKQQTEVKHQADQNANTSAKTAKVGQDSVSLTPQAKQMSELQKKNNDGPEINSKKIEELKKAIQSGSYKVDPEKLAASIAKFEFDII